MYAPASLNIAYGTIWMEIGITVRHSPGPLNALTCVSQRGGSHDMVFLPGEMRAPERHGSHVVFLAGKPMPPRLASSAV